MVERLTPNQAVTGSIPVFLNLLFFPRAAAATATAAQLNLCVTDPSSNCALSPATITAPPLSPLWGPPLLFHCALLSHPMSVSRKRKEPPQNHKTVLPIRRQQHTPKKRLQADGDTTLLPPPPLPPLSTLPCTHYVVFSGATHFTSLLVYSTLSGRAVRIDGIRAGEEAVGLRDYEVSFLRLLELVSVGATISINETGTAVKYAPGTLTGGHPLGLTHNCPVSRGVGYYLLPLLQLAPFMKTALTITLTGVTNHPLDVSVDLIRTVTLPLTRHFGLSPVPTVVVKRRGFLPLGGGEVVFTCPTVRQLTPINLTAPGLVKRVRGLSLTARCSPQHSTLMVDVARGPLNRLLPDVHIYTDHVKGKDAGPSPGFALSLVAESTTGCLYGREQVGGIVGGEAEGEKGSGVGAKDMVSASEVGSKCVKELLHEVSRGGCVDVLHQSFVLCWMVCTPERVSRVRLGRLSSWSVECLRLMERLFGVRVELKAEAETKTVICTVMGCGFTNVSRKTA